MVVPRNGIWKQLARWLAAAFLDEHVAAEEHDAFVAELAAMIQNSRGGRPNPVMAEEVVAF